MCQEEVESGIQQQPSLVLSPHLSPLWCQLGFLTPHARKPRGLWPHLAYKNSYTHADTRTTDVKQICMSMYTHILSDIHTTIAKNVYWHTNKKFAKPLRNNIITSHSQAHTLTGLTHTDTITVKPQRSEPEYSEDDVRPARPQIPLRAPFLSTLVSPLFPLVVTCWQPVAMTTLRCHDDSGRGGYITPARWFCGFGYCTGLRDNLADSRQTGRVQIQNKTSEEKKVPQRERERVNDKLLYSLQARMVFLRENESTMRNIFVGKMVWQL